MSRLEGGFTASAEASLTVAELVALLDRQGAGTEAERAQAIACYLAAGEGWREAVKRLGGAFATEAASGTLREGKAG